MNNTNRKWLKLISKEFGVSNEIAKKMLSAMYKVKKKSQINETQKKTADFEPQYDTYILNGEFIPGRQFALWLRQTRNNALRYRFDYVMINRIINPDTGKPFKDANEYCESSLDREWRKEFIQCCSDLLKHQNITDLMGGFMKLANQYMS